MLCTPSCAQRCFPPPPPPCALQWAPADRGACGLTGLGQHLIRIVHFGHHTTPGNHGPVGHVGHPDFGCFHPLRDVAAVPHDPNDGVFLAGLGKLSLDKLLKMKTRWVGGLSGGLGEGFDEGWARLGVPRWQPHSMRMPCVKSRGLRPRAVALKPRPPSRPAPAACSSLREACGQRILHTRECKRERKRERSESCRVCCAPPPEQGCCPAG